MSKSPTQLGRLYLVPNTLDFGCQDEGADLPGVDSVLPAQAMAVAARLQDWVAENAKSARLLLRRISGIVPLAAPLQALSIVEWPRARKGVSGQQGEAVNDWKALLAPALAGRDMGLVSEAGLPAVADPGAELVRAAHLCGVPVVPLAGPSSLVLALCASGLHGQSFAFNGYLPTETDARAQRIRELEARSRRERQTQLFIETPYRNPALLDALLTHLGPQTWLSVAVGLTTPEADVQTRLVANWRTTAWTFPAKRPAVFSFLA